MTEKILITGAGFIGSHTADLLIQNGHSVKILDCLHSQIHPQKTIPSYLSSEVEFQIGNICNADDVHKALEGVSIIYHFAAETGVGQSMYELERYFSTNVLGTSILWQEIQKRPGQIKKVILASSRAVYGEGRYNCNSCGFVSPQKRQENRLSKGDWLMYCSQCSEKLDIIPTNEDTPLQCTSIYAMNKKQQEEICIFMSDVLSIPLVILRYFNVYGSRQSLANPYTGVINTFCVRINNNNPVYLYEEGLPIRDFVHVHDIARANYLAIDADTGNITILNVGSGKSVSLLEIAHMLKQIAPQKITIETTQKFRLGDIFGCYACLEKVKKVLKYEPKVDFKQGLRELFTEISNSDQMDNFANMEKELSLKKILHLPAE